MYKLCGVNTFWRAFKQKIENHEFTLFPGYISKIKLHVRAFDWIPTHNRYYTMFLKFMKFLLWHEVPTVARPWRFLTHFSERIKDRAVKFWHNLYSCLQFVLSKFGIDIYDSVDRKNLGLIYQHIPYFQFKI